MNPPAQKETLRQQKKKVRARLHKFYAIERFFQSSRACILLELAHGRNVATFT